MLAGPENVFWRDGNAYFKRGNEAVEVGIAIRFFPAEWFPSSNKNDWTPWFAGSKAPLTNPGSAVLLQSKRFPLTWKRLLPETLCPSQIRWGDCDDWVIKPVFGRVGEDVGMRKVTSESDYRKLRREAEKHPEAWIAQRQFGTVAVQTEDGNVYPCIGVFTVNGEFAGIYGRASRTPLVNQDPQDVAVLVRPAAQKDVQ